MASTQEILARKGVESKIDQKGEDCFCGRMSMGREGCSVEFAYETVKMLKAGGLGIVTFVSISSFFTAHSFYTCT